MTALLRFTFALTALLQPTAQAADIPLYPTGPAEDSAFVRFANIGDTPLEIQASGSKNSLALTVEKPVSTFIPVAANKPLKGSLIRKGKSASMEVTVKPGEFATVIAGLPGTSAATTTVIREEPDDFNALRASLALYNVDPACAQAGLQTAERAVSVFSEVGTGQIMRRMINPVALSVQLTCGGKPQGKPLSLGTLSAGERYSVFAVPGASGTRSIFTTDTLAR